MRQTLSVDVKDYEIQLSDDDFEKLIGDVLNFTKNQKRLFVVSKKVFKLYCEKLHLSDFDVLVLNDGEKEKNFRNYVKILNTAEELGLTRNDVIIAIGGGVIGDIVGFASSTYMRGIDYIQIPTTLLSMVDSSVGGKTAIDMNGVKNIVGTFYQPKQVFININFLKTLDKRQFMSGVGEILKYAFIEDDCGYKHPLFFFEYLTLCCEKFLEQEPMTLMRVIEYSLRSKIAVVNQDEKESGLRKILNLGHTFGHALEALGKYKKFTHGEAVIQGIMFIFNYAYSHGFITYSYYRLSMDLIAKYGFKTIKYNYKPDDFLEYMKKDKKALSDRITFIIPSDKKKVQEIKLAYENVLQMFLK